MQESQSKEIILDDVSAQAFEGIFLKIGLYLMMV